MSTSYPPYYAYPSAPPLRRALPKPPRLHWGWVLALNIVTLGLFGSIWLLVQANWVRRMRAGKSTAFPLALANVIWLPLVFLLALGAGIMVALAPSAAGSGFLKALDPIIRICSFVLYVMTAFTLRKEMEADPISLTLGGGMTFLFAPVHFQYNLADYGTAGEQEFGLGLTPTSTEPGIPEQAAAYPTAAEVGVVYPPQQRPPTV